MAAPTPPTAIHSAEVQHVATPHSPMWKRFAAPLAVVLLAVAVIVTITRNWNAWEGGKAEQATDDAFVRGDITPLGTKVAAIVRDVKVSDYQQVHKGDLLVELQDDDFLAQMAQATAAVEAAKAAIENNRRQRDLQDARIERARAGIDQAKAQIAAAQAGKEAVRADVARTSAERARQEALFKAQSSTQQKLEAAVADDQRFAAMLATREADLQQAKTMMRSNELALEAERRSKSVLESQERQIAADLQAKEAALSVARINLGYTKILAPADGTVGERLVRPGQLVSPGTQVISLVSTTRWVQANFRETQLTNMRVGDSAEVRVDVYPGQLLHGKIVEIAPASGSQFALLPPDNASGNFTKVVQRIPTKIALEDSSFTAALRPGLSVVAIVRTKH